MKVSGFIAEDGKFIGTTDLNGVLNDVKGAEVVSITHVAYQPKKKALLPNNSAKTCYYQIKYLSLHQKISFIKDMDEKKSSLGLPRSIDEITTELKEAERELSDQSKWSTLSGFLSDFKQEHASWLK